MCFDTAPYAVDLADDVPAKFLAGDYDHIIGRVGNCYDCDFGVTLIGYALAEFYNVEGREDISPCTAHTLFVFRYICVAAETNSDPLSHTAQTYLYSILHGNTDTVVIGLTDLLDYFKYDDTRPAFQIILERLNERDFFFGYLGVCDLCKSIIFSDFYTLKKRRKTLCVCANCHHDNRG